MRMGTHAHVHTKGTVQTYHAHVLAETFITHVCAHSVRRTPQVAQSAERSRSLHPYHAYLGARW